jgi:flavin-binding protein dodecin
MAVLNSIELEGVSRLGWDDAAAEAVREAARTIRKIKRVDVLDTGGAMAEDGVVEYRTSIRLWFEIDRPDARTT